MVGEGKNLALLDIRFARTINRIQKAIIQELNKIAIIHLYVLGFEDELENFSLGLTNPSTQAELLKLEQWQTKITLYKDAVGDPGSGIAPVSATWAKKFILGMSDEEIKLDLQQQRFEKALAGELETTKEVIKKTGLFNTVDKLYGETPKSDTEDVSADEDSGLDMGSEDTADFDMGGPETEAPGGGDEVTEPVHAAESFNKEKGLPILMEQTGLSLNGLEEIRNRTNSNIDSISENIEELLED